MLAEQAAGKTIGIPAHTWVYVGIKTLAGPPQGTFDSATGTFLHFVYNGNMTLNGEIRSSSVFADPDYASPQLTVEFDAPACVSFPFDGTLSLKGGVGQYMFWVYCDSRMCISPLQYQPMLHTLTTFVLAGATFTIPQNHNYMLGHNATDTFQNVATGEILVPSTTLPGTPVRAGDMYIASRNVEAVTGWMG